MKKWIAALCALTLLLTSLPCAALAAADSVLFKGTAVGLAGEDAPFWTFTFGKRDRAPLSRAFAIEVAYEGAEAPALVLMSHSGGVEQATVAATETKDSVATYSYEHITAAFGNDFSVLNTLGLMAGTADVTVTGVKIVPDADALAAAEAAVAHEGPAWDMIHRMGAGWNLGNTLDAYNYGLPKNSSVATYETCWGNPQTTREIIAAVKAAGFDTIRIPVTWAQHIDDANGYAIDPAWMARVQETVDMALEADLIVIINLHHDTGTQGWLHASDATLARVEDKFIAVWTQIADHFKDYGDTLLFEGFNEILSDSNNWGYPGKEATNVVNILNQDFVNVVRASGGNNGERILIVNTYAAANGGNVLSDFVMPEDTVERSLIAEVHCYSPWNYCGTIGDGCPATNWRAAGGESDIDGVMRNLNARFVSRGIPVLIGEFSSGHKNNLEDRVDWTAYITAAAAQYDIPMVWWDNGGRIRKDAPLRDYKEMGILDRYNLEWLFPDIVEVLTGVRVENVHVQK